MKKKSFLSGLIIIAIFSLAFSGKEKPANDGVMLKADYGAKQQWAYAVSYTSQGNFRQKSENTAKSTTIKCLLKVGSSGHGSAGFQSNPKMTSKKRCRLAQYDAKADVGTHACAAVRPGGGGLSPLCGLPRSGRSRIGRPSGGNG